MPARISALMCHAPVVVPGVVGPRGAACARSTAAMREAARRIVARAPEVLVVVSPHTPRVAGAFHVVGGALTDTVAELAVTAATDPRFLPVDLAELSSLEPEVSLLSAPVPVASTVELDPAVWGVQVQSGWRHGVLLPGIDGIDSVDEQLRIA